VVVTGSSVTFPIIYVDNEDILEILRNPPGFPYVVIKAEQTFLQFDATAFFKESLYATSYL